MVIGVPCESSSHEERVALVPAVVPLLTKAGLKVLLERGAGEHAGFPDAAYEEQGASLASDRTQLLSSAELLVQVHTLDLNIDRKDLKLLRLDQTLIGLLNPLGTPEAVPELAAT